MMRKNRVVTLIVTVAILAGLLPSLPTAAAGTLPLEYIAGDNITSSNVTTYGFSIDTTPCWGLVVEPASSDAAYGALNSIKTMRWSLRSSGTNAVMGAFDLRKDTVNTPVLNDATTGYVYEQEASTLVRSGGQMTYTLTGTDSTGADCSIAGIKIQSSTTSGAAGYATIEGVDGAKKVSLLTNSSTDAGNPVQISYLRVYVDLARQTYSAWLVKRATRTEAYQETMPVKKDLIIKDQPMNVGEGKTVASFTGMKLSTSGGSASDKSNISFIKLSEMTGATVTSEAKRDLTQEELLASDDTTTTVTKNLVLPSVYQNADVAWSSSTTGVIANDGTVTRPSGSTNADVTMTATFTYKNGSAETRDFNFTVLADGQTAQDGAITPATANFDPYKNSENHRDVTVTLDSGSYALSAVKNGNATLAAGADYTADGNSYTIKASYLDKFTSDQTITFAMTGGTDPTLAVTYADTTIPSLKANPYQNFYFNSVNDPDYKVTVDEKATVTTDGGKLRVKNNGQTSTSVKLVNITADLKEMADDDLYYMELVYTNNKQDNNGEGLRMMLSGNKEAITAVAGNANLTLPIRTSASQGTAGWVNPGYDNVIGSSQTLGLLVNPAEKTIRIYQNGVPVNNNTYYFRYTDSATIDKLTIQFASTSTNADDYAEFESFTVYRDTGAPVISYEAKESAGVEIGSLSELGASKTLVAKTSLPAEENGIVVLALMDENNRVVSAWTGTGAVQAGQPTEISVEADLSAAGDLANKKIRAILWNGAAEMKPLTGKLYFK